MANRRRSGSDRGVRPRTGATPWVLLLVVLVLGGFVAGVGPALSGAGGSAGLRSAAPIEASGSARGESPATISVHPAGAILSVTLNVNRSNSPQNSPISFSGSVSPNTGIPYNLSWTNLPSGCSSGPPMETNGGGTFTLSCTPTATGPFDVGVSASNGTGALGSGQTSLDVYPDLAVTLSLSASSLSEGTQLQVSFTIRGGASPYQLNWNNLPNDCGASSPSSEPSSGSFQFQCDPSQSGGFQISVQVTDAGSPNPAQATSSQQSLQVNSNGNNGSNNGNGSNNNGSSSNSNGGNSSLSSLFSSLGGLLNIVFIAGILVFVLLVITAVSTLVTAILVARRLPPRSAALAAAGRTAPCPACGAMAPASSKFCPECGKPMASGKSPE